MTTSTSAAHDALFGANASPLAAMLQNRQTGESTGAHATVTGSPTNSAARATNAPTVDADAPTMRSELWVSEDVTALFKRVTRPRLTASRRTVGAAPLASLAVTVLAQWIEHHGIDLSALDTDAPRSEQLAVVERAMLGLARREYETAGMSFGAPEISQDDATNTEQEAA